MKIPHRMGIQVFVHFQKKKEQLKYVILNP